MKIVVMIPRNNIIINIGLKEEYTKKVTTTSRMPSFFCDFAVSTSIVEIVTTIFFQVVAV